MSRWPKWLPHPALLFVVLAWGLNFVVIKFTLEEWPVQVVMVLRYLLMVPVMGAYALAVKQTFKPEKKEWLKFLFAGFMSSGLYMVLFLEGMQRVGAAQGAVCLATVPIWVSIISVLTRQEAGRWQLFVGGGLAYAGVAGVIWMGTGERFWTPLGLGLVMASALVWATSVVLMKPLLKDRPAIGVYLATYAGAAFILVPYGGWATLTFDYSVIGPVGWLGLAYLTLIAGAGAFTAYYVGVREVGPAKASMVAYFVPVVAAITAWVVRGNALNALQIGGVVLVLVGVWLASVRGKKVDPAEAIGV